MANAASKSAVDNLLLSTGGHGTCSAKASMKLLIFTALFSATCLTTNRAAQASTRTEFIKSAGQIPNALINHGYRQIGQLDLLNMIRTMSSPNVQIVVVPQLKYAVSQDQVRSSAYYFCDPKTSRITISQMLWSQTPKQIRPILALHEFLGCSRFNDSIYNLSTVLNLISLPKTSKILSRSELAVLEDYAGKRLVVASRGGGIIGVGGGGDMGGAYIKSWVLEKNLDDMKKARSVADRDRAFTMLRFQLETGLEIKWKQRAR